MFQKSSHSKSLPPKSPPDPWRFPTDEGSRGLALGVSVLFHGLLFLALQFLVSHAAPFGIFSRERAVVAVDGPSLVIELSPPEIAEAESDPAIAPPLPLASEPTPTPASMPPALTQSEPVPAPEPVREVAPPEPLPEPAPITEKGFSVTPPPPELPAEQEPLPAPETEPAFASDPVPSHSGEPAVPQSGATPPAQVSHTTPASNPMVALPNSAPSAGPVSLLLEPRYRQAPAPPYPGAARRLGLEGRVLLDVHINAGGSVDTAALRESSGHRILDQAALAAVKRWRFHPATRGERAIPSSAIVPVEFRLE